MKEILLTQGYKAIVDDCDYAKVAQFKWTAKVCGNSIYAHRQIYSPHKTTLTMHRFVLDLAKGESDVDHKDGNGLNNTRTNLRLTTRTGNIANRGPSKRSPLGLKGVKKQKNRYLLRFGPGGTTYCGSFMTAIEAALAYDYWARHTYGEFARLNVYSENLAI